MTDPITTTPVPAPVATPASAVPTRATTPRTPSRPTPVRPGYSVAELRAAATALTGGVFSAHPTRDRVSPETHPRGPQSKVVEAASTGSRTVTSSDPAHIETACAGTTSAETTSAETTSAGTGCVEAGTDAAAPASGLVVRVQAVHGGAGASTLALALADTAATSSEVQLIDAAAPAWSALAGASHTEMGTRDGWHHGRRGDRIHLDRLAHHADAPRDVPAPPEPRAAHPAAAPPRPGPPARTEPSASPGPSGRTKPSATSGPGGLTVLDTGWTVRELTACPGCWLSAHGPGPTVLVTRLTATALGQVETALAALEAARTVQTAGTAETVWTVVAVVGARRWNGARFASAGPRLRQLHATDDIAYLPLLTPRTMRDLGPGPLPRALMLAADDLLSRLTAPAAAETKHPATDPTRPGLDPATRAPTGHRPPAPWPAGLIPAGLVPAAPVPAIFVPAGETP